MRIDDKDIGQTPSEINPTAKKPIGAPNLEDLQLALDSVIADYDKRIDEINEGPSIVEVTPETTAPELREALKLVRKEKERIGQMQEILDESEAMGDSAPKLRSIINDEESKANDFETTVKSALQGGDLAAKIESVGTSAEVGKKNPFLMPALNTSILEVMLEVMKQKRENQDLERTLKIDMIGMSWSWAKEAAQAALDKGEAKKAQLICDATAALVTGLVHVGTGIATYANFQRVKGQVDLMDGKTPAEKETHLYSRLQNDPLSSFIRTLDQSLPQVVQSISSFTKTKFVTDEAKAEAAQVISNTLKEMCDKMYQAAHEQFSAEGQQIDQIKQFLEQFFAATTRILRGG